MSVSRAVLDEPNHDSSIRTRTCLTCLLCGHQGQLLYQKLNDRLFGAPGTWNVRRCSNRKCKLLWLDPLPLPEEIHKAYRTYYTHDNALSVSEGALRRLYNRIVRGYLALCYDYRSDPISTLDLVLGFLLRLHPVRRVTFASTIYFLRANRGGRLLEIGCGNGSALERLNSLGWRAEGLDPDPEAVECARRRGLRVHLGSLYDQKLQSESFDAIVSSHVIEHVADPCQLLTECYRLLKPGGHLVAITPNAESWGHRFYRSDWRGLEPPRHLQIFTLDSLRFVCQTAGFEHVHCRPLVKANVILLSSRLLRQTNKVDLSRGLSFAQRFSIEISCLAEWAASLIDRQAPEELIVNCRKAE